MAATSELQARLDPFVQQAGDLYSLPRVAAEVLELTRDATIDTARLKQCIENDPALVAKLLRVVNSSLFGLCREVSDLNQAVALLGIKPLKLLVLGFSLPEGLYRHVAADFLSSYWRHTLTTAVAAREICALLKEPAGDEAFIGGLLKHLGMLVLVQQVGAPYVQFVERMQAHGMDLLAAEKLALGFDHGQLTVRLLEQWRLPDGIIQMAAGTRGEAAPEPVRRMTQLLDSADAMAVWLVHPRVDTLPSLQQSLRALGSIKEGKFGELLVSLHEKVQQLANVLSLELPARQSAERLTLDAYYQLCAAAQEAAGEMIRPAPRDADPLALEATDRLRQSFDRLTRSTEPRPGRAALISSSAAVHAASSSGTATTLTACGAELLDELIAALATCRQHRQPLALAILALDRVDDSRRASERAQRDAALKRWREACHDMDLEGTRCLEAGQGRLALILPDCERQEAARLARQLLTIGGRTAPPGASHAARASVSMGIAAIGQIPRNFPAEELLSAAERCLSGAQASGGNCVKSMDL